MNDKYNDIELAQLAIARKSAPTVRLFADHVRNMARTDKTWRGEAAKQLRLDLEHNNSGWCAVEITKESYDNGPVFILTDVEI